MTTDSEAAYHTILVTLACKYHKLLSVIDWSDRVFVAGIKEGRNKFLTNTYLAIFADMGIHKHHRSHAVSLKAKQQLAQKKYRGLVFEHVVPKERYIQKPCEDRARAKDLTVEFVAELLLNRWIIATVTSEEDRKLKRTMPQDWNGKDVFARYRAAEIPLVRNDEFLLDWSPTFGASYLEAA